MSLRHWKGLGIVAKQRPCPINPGIQGSSPRLEAAIVIIKGVFEVELDFVTAGQFYSQCLNANEGAMVLEGICTPNPCK